MRDNDTKFPSEDDIRNYDATNHPAHLVRRVHQRAAQVFNQTVLMPNLTATQFVTLATLLKHGPLPQKSIAELASIDPATLTVVIRKLEESGLIDRIRSEEDRRVWVISLTEAGRRCGQDHITISLRAGKALLAPLTPVESTVFIELLRKLIAAEDDQN